LAVVGCAGVHATDNRRRSVTGNHARAMPLTSSEKNPCRARVLSVGLVGSEPATS